MNSSMDIPEGALLIVQVLMKGLCYTSESYSLEEKKEVCND